MKALNNYIIFKTTRLHNDSIDLGGKKLFLEVGYDPARHVCIHGEVTSVPVRLSPGIMISQQHRGLPSYYEQTPYSYRFLDDVEQDVEVGDKIFFHFNTVKSHNIVKVDGTAPNRTWYIKVRYDQVICAVRNGEIIMIGGHTLIDPDFESWADISVPTYSDLLDEDGKKIVKPENQWLVTKSSPTYKHRTGFVKKVGKPLRGDKCEIKEGQKILYQTNADWMVRIEDRDYFVIKQRNIEGRWEATEE